MNDWNRQIIEEFRANAGKVSGFPDGAPLLLLTTTGKRSGKRRTTLLAYQSDEDRLIVIAANRGTTKNPDWYHNLMAHPGVTVEIGKETFSAIATLVDGEEREHFLAKGRESWSEALESQPEQAGVSVETARQMTGMVIALTQADLRRGLSPERHM